MSKGIAFLIDTCLFFILRSLTLGKHFAIFYQTRYTPRHHIGDRHDKEEHSHCSGVNGAQVLSKSETDDDEAYKKINKGHILFHIDFSIITYLVIGVDN